MKRFLASLTCCVAIVSTASFAFALTANEYLAEEKENILMIEYVLKIAGDEGLDGVAARAEAAANEVDGIRNTEKKMLTAKLAWFFALEAVQRLSLLNSINKRSDDDEYSQSIYRVLNLAGEKLYLRGGDKEVEKMMKGSLKLFRKVKERY